MRRYYIELSCHVLTSGQDRLEQHVVDVMDALMEEPGVIDPDVTAELATGRVTVTMTVAAERDAIALEKALVVARSAVHKAGGNTGGWLPRPPVIDRSTFVVEDGFDARVRPAGLTPC